VTYMLHSWPLSPLLLTELCILSRSLSFLGTGCNDQGQFRHSRCCGSTVPSLFVRHSCNKLGDQAGAMSLWSSHFHKDEEICSG
jgi:hypothetical protein